MVPKLVSSLALLSVCVRASDWRGISPALQRKLRAVSSFTCDHGQQLLARSRINDNYCDCVDGSDEPGTSACSHTSAVFHCVNAGFFSSDVPTSRVNDGICDCCDGSDEYASGASCSVNCDVEMQNFKVEKKDLVEQVDAGIKDREILAAEAEKLWDEEMQKTQQLEASTASLRMMAEQLEARKAEEERLEQQEKDSRVEKTKQEIYRQLGLLKLTKAQLLEIVLEVGRQGVNSKHELLPIIRKEREAGGEEGAKTPMDELDEAFVERDDERQKETRRIEKIIEERRKAEEEKAQEAKEALEKAAEDAAAAAEGGEAAEVVAEPETAVIAEEEVPKEKEDLTLPEVETRPIELLFEELVTSESYERSQAVLTRKQHEDTAQELKEEEKKLAEAKKLVDKDYGVDHLFFALRDKCVESEAGQYTYKICFFGKATQDHTKLGDMEEIKAPESSESSGEGASALEKTETIVEEIKFTNGQKCWNGPNRSLTVKLECGPEPMLLSDIEEPSTCVYSAKLRTPAICSEGDRERIMTFDDGRVTPHHIEIEVPATL